MDRLAFSAVWTVDAETAEVIDVRFHKSVIRSVAAMSYGAAQGIIDDAADTSPLAMDLRMMLKLTQRLRAARVARGALSLASPEVPLRLFWFCLFARVPLSLVVATTPPRAPAKTEPWVCFKPPSPTRVCVCVCACPRARACVRACVCQGEIRT